MIFATLYTLLGILAGYQLGKLDDSHSERMVFPYLKFFGAVLAIFIIAAIQWASA